MSAPDSLASALDAEREATSKQINPLRLAGVGLFWLLTVSLGFIANQPAWRANFALLSTYFGAAAVLWFFGRRAGTIARHFALGLALVDVPLVYLFQRGTFDTSTSAGAVAGFTIALYAVIVAVSALSLDVKQVAAVAVIASGFGIALQLEAGISIGGCVSTLVVLGVTAIAGFLLFRRLISLMKRLLDDVAYRRKLQQQLEHSDRMSTLGLLSASIAHEVGSPLLVLQGNLELLQMQAEKRALTADEVRDGVTQALKGAERVSLVLQDIRGMARTDATKESEVDVKRVVEGVGKLTRSEVARKAQLLFQFADTPKVRMSESRLSQVLLNLVLNGAQAIEGGERGKQSVTVATKTTADGWVAISVTDTGKGIAPEHRARLFTPFFTTKPVGEGTGLGLSISAQLVRDAGGRIEVDSIVGRGTTFTVMLPPASMKREIMSGPSSWRQQP
ncbi:MAG: HAMP domain-containing sensor histidine kinase [Archangium sp.]